MKIALAFAIAVLADVAASFYFADWRVAMPLGLVLYAACRIPLPKWLVKNGE